MTSSFLLYCIQKKYSSIFFFFYVPKDIPVTRWILLCYVIDRARARDIYGVARVAPVFKYCLRWDFQLQFEGSLISTLANFLINEARLKPHSLSGHLYVPPLPTLTLLIVHVHLRVYYFVVLDRFLFLHAYCRKRES